MKQNTILYMIGFGLLLALAFVFLNNNDGLVIEAAHAQSTSEKANSNRQKQGLSHSAETYVTNNNDSEHTGLSSQKDKKELKPNTHQDCDVCPVLVAIPEGEYHMGDDEGEENEKPVHSVKVDKFYLSVTEVTFDQWDACHQDGGCAHLPDDNGWGRGNRPVINVSWNDVQAYLQWLNKKTGRRYRLPSEAEWEYAARAGSQKKYAMGDEITCDQAKYGTFSGDCIGEKATVPVGSYSANAFGLYDMHGNVWEWVDDCYYSDYYGAAKNASPRKGNEDCIRILRGGSWFVNADNLRSAYRLWNAAATRIYSLGFRVARD